MIKKTLFGLLFLAVLCGACKKEINQVPTTHQESIETSGKKKNRPNTQGWTKFGKVHSQTSRVVIAIGHRNEQNKIEWGELGYMWYSIQRIVYYKDSLVISPIWKNGILSKVNNRLIKLDLKYQNGRLQCKRKGNLSLPKQVVGIRLFQLSDQKEVTYTPFGENVHQDSSRESHLDAITYDMIGKTDRPNELDDLKKEGFIVGDEEILF